MKDTFTPGVGVKIIPHSVVINVPGKNGKVVPTGKEREEPGTGSQGKGFRRKARTNRAETGRLLANLKIRSEEIEAEQLTKEVAILYQVIELLYEDNEQVRAERQELRDALALLMGEQGKPKIKGGQKKDKEGKEGDISSEKERKKSQAVQT